MSNRSLVCASVVLFWVFSGCKAPAPNTGSQAMGISSAKQNSDAAARQEQWDLPDTDRPVIKDKPQADTLAEQTKEYADRIARAAPDKNPKPARHETGGPEDVAPKNPRLASNTATGNAAVPSDVEFGNLPATGQKPDAANSPSDPQKASSSQAPGGASASPITTVTPAVTSHGEPPINKDTPVPNTTLLRGQVPQLSPTDEVAQRLYKAVKEYPQDPAAQLDYQLMLFLQNQSVPQLQMLSALSGEDREMLTTLFDGLTNFRNSLRADNNMLLSKKIRPLLEVGQRLQTQAELNIPTLALCTDVRGFGSYDPIDPARFEAGKEHKIIVYCEVENFASILNQQQQWETRLTQDVVLYTEGNGLEVWRDKTPARPIVDSSRNRRHDFFIVKMIRLPANLTLGRYILKVSVVDQQVKRVAENATPILVVAQ